MFEDLQFTVRAVWRSKVFALLAIVAFSFGIGSTATVFSVIDSVLLRPAAFPDPASVVVVEAARGKGDWDNVAPSVYGGLRSRADLFSQVAAVRKSLFTVTHVPVPDQVFGFAVSGNLFSFLEAKPWRGRLLTLDDDEPGAPPAILLSYKAWQQLFQGDPGVVGKTAQVDGDVCTVVGIMPADFVLPSPNAGGLVWTALRMTPAELSSPNARWLQVFARLRPSASTAAVQQRLDVLARTEHDPVRLRATKWTPETDQNQKLILWLAMGMVGGLLLIGCANLSSVLLARAIGRRRDYAIRVATGASRGQLIRQALLEVFLLAFAALGLACLGTPAALGLIRNYLTTAGAGIPYLAHVQLNARSLLFSFGIALVCALLCGLFPAFATTNVDLASGLRESGTQMDGRQSSRRFLHGLLAVEAGIALLLLLTSGLLVRSLSRMLSDDHGLRPDRVLTLRLPTGAWQTFSTKKTPEEQQRLIAKYVAMLHQAQSVSGVQAAALASSLPLSHVSVRTWFSNPNHEQVLAITQAVTSDYFKVMGIPILSGHTFSPGGAKHKVLMVNQAFAQQYFHGENPVGRFVLGEDPKDSSQIIGLVKDSPHRDLTEAIEPELYVDFEQTSLMPFLTGLVARTQADPNTLRRALAEMDANQAVVQVKTLRTLINENIWQPRFSAWLSSVFAGIALCLCGTGIYGVVAFITAERRREFGIRSALGAGRGSLLWIAATQSLTPVMVGSCFGVIGFYWVSQWMAALLYKVSPFDPVNAMAGGLLLVVISVMAVAAPALRAARVDPAITLRHE